MQLGLIGLGKMGGNMAERLRLGSHQVVGFDFSAEAVQKLTSSGNVGVSSLEDLAKNLKGRKAIWIMVPQGKPVDDTIAKLEPLLNPGDILIDGGNSNYKDSQRHYKEVTAKQGGAAKTTDFARLFMMPGMGHCGGGDGPNVFDNFTPLVNWVENGRAPDAIVATKYMNNPQAQGTERTRPVCAYPGVAKWKGADDPTKAENFACVMP